MWSNYIVISIIMNHHVHIIMNHWRILMGAESLRRSSVTELWCGGGGNIIKCGDGSRSSAKKGLDRGDGGSEGR
jgi:hypothetical protein